MAKVGTPKGTRDFSPEVVLKRKYMFDVMAQTFEKFGYMPLETPCMENLSVLTGKYGEEGDRLIFKILNSGDYLSKVPEDLLAEKNSRGLVPKISEKGLRYDLTVPFARFVVQHQNDLVFPFKRYQMQPVWRADRPQKGRYREFYQCDCDVVGSESLLLEVEQIQIFDEVFTKLEFEEVLIHINNRKILTGIADAVGELDKLVDLTIAMDKLDKIGKEKVLAEMGERGISADAIAKLPPLFDLKDEDEKFNYLQNLLAKSEVGQKGLEELKTVLELSRAQGVERLFFEPTLARGLDYYTGTIFECKSETGGIGTLGSGGRYDNLTEVFGVSGLPGIGISFGAERIYDLMVAREKFPKELATITQALIVQFGDETLIEDLKLAKLLRDSGVSTELYPGAVKMKKQMKYANQKSIPVVLMQGEEEVKNGVVTVKVMANGEQKELPPGKIAEFIQSL